MWFIKKLSKAESNILSHFSIHFFKVSMNYHSAASTEWQLEWNYTQPFIFKVYRCNLSYTFTLDHRINTVLSDSLRDLN
jgi:hypothetical protein